MHAKNLSRGKFFHPITLRLGLTMVLAVTTPVVQPLFASWAATIAVSSLLDNTAPGDGFCTLREAINNANADADTTGGDCGSGTGADTITLPTGIYNLTITGSGEDGNARGDLDILAAGGDLAVQGADAGGTIIQGLGIIVGTDRVFHIDPGGVGGITVDISGLTIRNGNTGSNGGGIYNGGSNLVNLTNSTVAGNEAAVIGGVGGGGGIYNAAGGVVNLIDSILDGNRAAGKVVGSVALGGGIYNQSAGVVNLLGSTVRKNTASTIAGPGSRADGGGIWNGGALTVQNGSWVGMAGAGNQAVQGGGVFNAAGSTTLDGSTVSGNNAVRGGGIRNEATLTVRNGSVIGGNAATAGDGGGIFNDHAVLMLSHSAVTGNSSTGEGGGVYSEGDFGGATLTLDGATISGNTAERGGGLYLYYSSAAAANSTLSGNQAAASGGGIGTLSDNPRTIDLVHCSIAANTAGTRGGGMFLETAFTVNLFATLVAGNDAGGNGPDILGVIHSRDYNLIQNTSDTIISGSTAHTVTGEEPRLGPLADNGGATYTHALLAGSPAIDVIPLSVCTLAEDQRGVSRPQGAACDIGAYEAATRLHLPLVLS